MRKSIFVVVETTNYPSADVIASFTDEAQAFALMNEMQERAKGSTNFDVYFEVFESRLDEIVSEEEIEEIIRVWK